MKRQTERILAAVLVAALAVSCAVNPVTGRRELSLISEEGEISLGKETDASIKQTFGIYNDPNLTAYVNGVGMKLAPLTHRPQLPYSFQILDTPVINAFAVPGGYIYVTRGILAMMNSEAELAAVLGHELGHVNARHSVRRMSQMILLQVGLAMGSALNDTFAQLAGVASVGIQILYLKYSRDDERQADALGVEYSRRASYNPGLMVGFFHCLQKLGDLSGGRSLPGFLSTHPLEAERIKNVTAMLSPSDERLAVRGNEYLARINNIIYGDDPRQGYVEAGAFYHPTLRFQFAVPAQWAVENTPSRVTLVSKDKQAAFLLEAEKSQESLPNYAAKKTQSIEGRRFLSDQRLAINGLSSYHQMYDIPQQNADTLRARFSFIRKNAMIYTFTALSTMSHFGGYDNQFQQIVRSFRNLSDSRYINRQPARLRLVKADGRRNLQALFQANGIAKDLWPKLAIQNSLELTQVPTAGRVVKIVR
ncbi:MAG: M48 family metalloprotease [Candidatus Aminicenantes bacterium]|nr:M48 family metalloprotease [Candidatus Aminicenantes bacterium]